MVRQMLEFFEDNCLFRRTQFAYRSGKSTSDAIGKMYSFILEAFEQSKIVNATFCDPTKAYDTILNDLIVSKHSQYKINLKIVQTIESYLKGCSQLVCSNSSLSNVLQVETDVPQGSLLGPFLFLVVVNDLSSNIERMVISYADDTTIIVKSNEKQELEHLK